MNPVYWVLDSNNTEFAQVIQPAGAGLVKTVFLFPNNLFCKLNLGEESQGIAQDGCLLTCDPYGAACECKCRPFTSPGVFLGE
jgi:hypothetical protein